GVVARIIFNPLLIGLRRLVQFPGHETVVVGGNRELFAFARMGAILKGLALVFARPSEFSQTGIVVGQAAIGRGEIGIQFNGALVVSAGLGRALFHAPAATETERLQG